MLALAAGLAAWLALGVGHAQELATKIWDIKLGTAVAALPLDQFVDPACGTNGGPPSRVLGSFADFALCPPDKATGLHEVWFRYDDELEYVARARRSEIMIRLYQANVLGGQPIITSLLIDDAGLIQGYRIVNDPRAAGATRIEAYGLVELFKGMVAPGLDCVDLPPGPGERPIEDLFVKQSCEVKADGQVTKIEARRYYRPGQFLINPNDNRMTENEFESSARLEVYRAPAGK
ncbi:MAG TPA: hypothetical protein VGI22_04710 [Xanthobacteraceae bacterium]